MKTNATLTLTAPSGSGSRKNLLITGLDFLVSRKFLTFATVTALTAQAAGILAEDDLAIAAGAIAITAAWTPWVIRATVRDMISANSKQSK